MAGEQSVLEAEMRQLEAEIARLLSVERIERRAGEIGLAPATDPIYVHIGEAGPEPSKIPAEYLPKAAEPGSGLAP